ncbi:MAG TPA: DUF1697 domain-containing protein [Candidatus Binatia bacterium]|nr:DUF1697 domain-containing protein [Candidatus Binatia bacterium]
MPIYVAMLRGINVGPHKRIRMDRLRQSFESLGFESVATYIQSGNVVFKAAKQSPAALTKRIEKQLLADFGLAVPVICRTAAEMNAALGGNPFLTQPGADPAKLHVMFLAVPPSDAAAKQFLGSFPAPEAARVVQREIYLYLPHGVSQSNGMKAPAVRILAVGNTTRNWNTVTQLAKMCAECPG